MHEQYDLQNVHRQPAHKLTNDDATDESLLWRLRDPSWTTAFKSKLEKYLITHLHAWSIAMEHVKNYEIMQNYLEYTNKTNGTFFPGNVIYDFWA